MDEYTNQDFDSLLNMAADIAIYTKKGRIFQDKGLVAIDKNTNKILAMGAQVLNSVENGAFNNVKILVPFQYGFISEYTAAEKLIKYFLSKNHLANHLIKTKIAVVIPEDYSEIQKKAIEDMTLSAGAKEVYIVLSSFDRGKYDKIIDKYPILIEIGKVEPELYVTEMVKWFVSYAEKNGVSPERLIELIRK